MKGKNARARILAAALLAGILAGCGNQPAQSQPGSSTPASSPEAVSTPSGPDLSEPVDLTWYIYDANYEDEGKVLDAMN